MSNAKQMTGFDIQAEIKARLSRLAEIEQQHTAAPKVEDVRRELRELAALCSMSKIGHSAVAEHLGLHKSTVTNSMREGFSVSIETLLKVRDGYNYLIHQQFEGLQKLIEQ